MYIGHTSCALHPISFPQQVYMVVEASNPSISRTGVLVFALQESHGHPIRQALDNLVYFERNILHFIASLCAILSTIASGQELVVTIAYEI